MRRSFLYVLIVSVVLSALLGIIALLSSRLGETEIKVLLSTLCVAGASILSLACAAVLERGRAQAFATPGIGAAILGFLLFLIGIWGESDSEGLWKSAASLVIAACFCAHAALLCLARLAQHHKWVRPATIVCTALLALLLIVRILGETWTSDTWRIVGILAILGTAGTILTAVFQRMARGEDDADTAAPRSVHCPHCGEALPESLLRQP